MKKNTTTKQVYKRIKDMILSCELEPGQMIFEKDLMTLLDAGRTPLREALYILRGENLVINIPNKGIQISPLSLTSLQEIYQVRKVLEPYALKEAMARISEEDIAYLETIRSEHASRVFNDQVKDIFNYGAELHLFFAEKSGNKVLLHILKMLRDTNNRGHIYFYRAFIDTKTEAEKAILRKKIAQNHIGIIDAIKENNVEKAIQYLEEDIRTMSNIISGSFTLDED